MIDFHSHILPGIDDGSKDPEMSLKMVAALQEQGVDTVCATSHFYAMERSPQRPDERIQSLYRHDAGGGRILRELWGIRNVNEQ